MNSSMNYQNIISCLFLSKDLDPFFNRLLLLFLGAAFRATEDQLSNESPIRRDIPLLGDGGVNDRVVVLEVCPKSESPETSPYYFGGVFHISKIALDS